MSKFSERVYSLRVEMNLSLRQLSKITGISPSAIHSYEVGTREAGYQSLEALSDVFNCDIEYLLGKTDVKNSAAAALGVSSLAEFYKKNTPPSRSEEISGDEKDVLELYRSLSEETRPLFVNLMRSFGNVPEKDQPMVLALIDVALNKK